MKVGRETWLASTLALPIDVFSRCLFVQEVMWLAQSSCCEQDHLSIYRNHFSFTFYLTMTLLRMIYDIYLKITGISNTRLTVGFLNWSMHKISFKIKEIVLCFLFEKQDGLTSFCFTLPDFNGAELGREHLLQTLIVTWTTINDQF